VQILLLTHRYGRIRKTPPEITVNKGDPQTIIGFRVKICDFPRKIGRNSFRVTSIEKSLTNAVPFLITTRLMPSVMENQIEPVVFESRFRVTPLFPKSDKTSGAGFDCLDIACCHDASTFIQTETIKASLLLQNF